MIVMSLQVAVLEQAEEIQNFQEISTTFTAILSHMMMLLDHEPVKQDSGKIVFHPKLMIEKQYYPFNFKDKKYLLKKTDKNIIDIYEIKE